MRQLALIIVIAAALLTASDVAPASGSVASTVFDLLDAETIACPETSLVLYARNQR